MQNYLHLVVMVCERSSVDGTDKIVVMIIAFIIITLR